jgi:hypothetical protein
MLTDFSPRNPASAPENLWESHIPAYATEILKQATSFELLSLNPFYEPNNDKSFYGYRILGKTVVENDEAKKLFADLEKGVAEQTSGPMDCFNPRHGIHAVANGEAADIVICFECRQCEVFANGKASGKFYVSKSPSTSFNAALTKARVHIAKPTCSN